MQRRIAWLLLLVMLVFTFPAAAQEEFTMAGYDDVNVGHVWETNLFFQRMEEQTGVHFIFDQSNEFAAWQQKKEAMFSSGELPDVLLKAELTLAETQRYYEAGQLIDLKPYLASCMPNLSALLAAHPAWEQAITLPDGAIAALPGINPLQNNNAMWINQSWLTTLGLDMPTDAASLTEVLRAFQTSDPNRNGKADEIPLSFLGMWDLRFLGHAFGLVSNDYYVYTDAQGQVQTTLNTDENRAFLTWLHQLWEERLIDRSGFTTADTLRQITDSDAAMTYGLFFAPTPLNLVPSSALSQYAMLLPLEYQGQRVYRDFLGDVIRGTFAITSSCKDPETLLRWVDTFYTAQGSQLAQSGMEGVEYTVNADGTWYWNDDIETVANTVLSEATIADGGNMPGLFPAEMQLLYDNSDTHRLVSSMVELKSLSVLPYPLLYLDNTSQTRVDEIQLELGRYAETAMVRFVTGDIPLDDAHWNTFTAELEALGLSEMLSIWQNALQ